MGQDYEVTIFDFVEVADERIELFEAIRQGGYHYGSLYLPREVDVASGGEVVIRQHSYAISWVSAVVMSNPFSPTALVEPEPDAATVTDVMLVQIGAVEERRFLELAYP